MKPKAGSLKTKSIKNDKPLRRLTKEKREKMP
jgi:hypothetical protein